MLRDIDRRITAYHEAGHVVIGHLMGLRVYSVYAGEEIFCKEKKISGLTVFALSKNGWCGTSDYFYDSVSKHEKQAKIYAAGRIVEQLFFPNDWSRYCSHSDWEGIKRELEYCDSVKISNIIISTRKLLRKKETNCLVRKIAWVLYGRGHLNHLEIPIILGIKKRKWRIKRKLKQFFSKIKRRVLCLVKK